MRLCMLPLFTKQNKYWPNPPLRPGYQEHCLNHCIALANQAIQANQANQANHANQEYQENHANQANVANLV